MNRDKIKELLDTYSYSDYKMLFDKYSSWLTKKKIEPSVVFPNSMHEIAIFQFRCNESISFNDQLRNNDLLVLMKIVDNQKSIQDFMFDTTCDPCTTKPGIAHSAAQIYRGNVGPHRGDSNRPCIRSDYGFGTWYYRTNSKGDLIDLNPSDDFTSIAGHIGINIHNANGAYNSSLGCTIFNSDDAYQKVFRPLITGCSNKSNIPVVLIDAVDLEDILGSGKDNPDEQ
jgi:hypothetical protein